MNDVHSGLIVALGGAIMGLMGKIFFDWVKGSRNGNGKTKTNRIIQPVCPLDRSNVIDDLKWLKDQHSHFDEDGVPIWYMPRRMIKILEQLLEVNKKKQETLNKIDDVLHENKQILIEIVKDKRK